MDINDKKTAVKRLSNVIYDKDFDEFGECMKCGHIFINRSSVHKFCPGCGRKITGIVQDKEIKLYPPFSDGDKKMLEEVFAGIATIEQFEEFQEKFREQKRLFVTYGENYNSAYENLTNALMFRFNHLFTLENDFDKTTITKRELKDIVKEEVRKILHENNN